MKPICTGNHIYFRLDIISELNHGSYLFRFLAHLVLSCAIQRQPLLYLTITRRQILDSSKLNDFSEDNLKFEENGRKLFKPVGNTVGKGEIARYQTTIFRLFRIE